MGRKGFSIVSVMVASVLVGVLAVGLASMLRDSTRGARSVQAMSEITDRYNEISLMLKAPELCKDGMITPGAAGALAKVNDTSVTAAAFPGAVVALDRLVLKGSQLARLNANFGNTGMRVQNLQLALDPGASEVGASQRRYTARLRIGLQGAANVRQRQTNVWDQSKDFRLSLLVNRATGDIVSCTLEGDGDAQMPDCGEGQVWGKAKGSTEMSCVPMALMTEEYRLGRNALPPGLSAADQHRIWPTSCLTTSGPVKCSYQRVTTTDPNVGASNRKCIYSGGEWKYRTGSGANRAFNGVCTGGITYNPYSSDEASSLTLRPSLAGNNLSDANNEDLDVVFCKLNSTSTWVQCRGRCKINGAGTWVHIPGKGKCAKYKAGPALPGMDSDDDPGSPDE